MAVHRNKVRRQITFSADIDARLRRIADQRHMSVSSLLAEAALALPEHQDQWERMSPFVGILKGGGSQVLTDEDMDRIIVGA
jgi:hypothetical protein